jgi:anti-sigma regulatory factor (Ser/Thr protein kinase)
LIDAPSGRLAFELQGGLDAAAAARRAIVAGNGRLPDTVRKDVLLLVTELVSNAVRHAGAGPERPLRVELLHRPGWVAVAVADHGSGRTWHPTPSPGDESGGWGLFLVDRIADRWGVECTSSRNYVWFEIAYDGEDHPSG